MDLDEPERIEVRAEEVADGGLKPEDGLVGRGLGRAERDVSTGILLVAFAEPRTHPQVHNPVVQPSIQPDPSELSVLLFVIRLGP